MTAVGYLAPWHTRFAGQLAGSIYAAPASARVNVAQQLSMHDCDVHVDVMAESEGLPPGVSLDELRTIAAVVDPARIAVHLIGSPAFVDEMLAPILTVRPATVFLPWDAFTVARAAAVRAAGAAAWVALWREWDGLDPASGPTSWPATPDGVLVMLIEPGSTNRSALGRLAVVTACSSDLPVAVDGGVTESVAELCLTAGARSIVVGRALFNASNEGTP